MGTVAVWKRAWLPPSETFIRNQLRALDSWNGLPFGVARLRSSLSSNDDVILFGDGWRDRILLALFRLGGSSRRVEHFLRDNNVDVVHAHFGSEAVSIWRQCRKLRIPLVVTLHGHDISAAPRTSGVQGWRYRRRLRLMFAYASRVVAVSDYIRDLAIERGAAPEKVKVRYIGIPVAGPVSSTSPNEGKNWDIAFVGRLTQKKGVRDLLQAVARVRAGGATSVVIVGSGPLESELRDYAVANGLIVDFLGHLPPDEVRAVLERARLFVAPSQSAPDGDAEGFGLVFLEAALAGLPVVAYAHGGVVEAVKNFETGLLCPEGDVESLALAIERMLADPARARAMGAAGRARVIREFNINDRTRDLESLYDEVLDERSGGRVGRG